MHNQNVIIIANRSLLYSRPLVQSPWVHRWLDRPFPRQPGQALCTGRCLHSADLVRHKQVCRRICPATIADLLCGAAIAPSWLSRAQPRTASLRHIGILRRSPRIQDPAMGVSPLRAWANASDTRPVGLFYWAYINFHGAKCEFCVFFLFFYETAKICTK